MVGRGGKLHIPLFSTASFGVVAATWTSDYTQEPLSSRHHDSGSPEDKKMVMSVVTDPPPHPPAPLPATLGGQEVLGQPATDTSPGEACLLGWWSFKTCLTSSCLRRCHWVDSEEVLAETEIPGGGGRGGGGGGEGREGELCLTLYCQYQNDSYVKDGQRWELF